ncbi:DUF1329 domain-containing protein [Marinicella meishanensis]|uniref:DUF1329 domain-containing protein n=1 Tax=Marinicella meishanensis TaxID=2873263 RepID=UPI001CC09E01|nr:DUF1329 domain-containing protein [Marinicella sp. NBU2979]
MRRVRLCLCLCLSWLPLTTWAQVDAEQVQRLGTELTPMGAPMSGDDAGIPRWQDVPAVDPAEKPLFTITQANYQQHLAHLTAGQVALFKAYPNTFQMPVYPSHRTFAAPDWVYANTRNNATSARLNADQTGVLDSQGGIPFPLPQSAAEVYFNHVLRWRGQQLKTTSSHATVNEQGRVQLSTHETVVRFDHYLNDNPHPNRLFSAIAKTTAPATQSGSGGLVLEPLDQWQEPRSAWLWDKGRRRVIRAPILAYDQPINNANGLRTADDTDMINGAPDRFNWQLLPQRTVYIPYNNDRLNDKSLTYDDLLQPGHLNPQHTRYELQRVWVIRATLKPEWRHLYSQRDFYVDADSWSVAVADQYDQRGELFRVSLSYLHQDPNMPGTFPVVNVYHDLPSGKYHVMGLQNELKSHNDYQAPLVNSSLFSTNGLKRFVK